ncbi:copper amine oxidase N-terminal domain-containing protein [Anaerotignum sp.]|uniref:copper amine oxidase N-terminal domain-containing protein n=1 Tax=Anaerotignum sp. TaxID=2039241 RepID=UPI002A910071|nr:copper amine oxidase N-terminal domain-containing protein [Anaerotignum sp.]MCI7657291.1 copper amine oxidase N-terminal domain-containing protein [Clostridia bacterium]MDY5415515.1 copper amine oxidase N-terminal domain-containing protein [Anaerotignum sp.]
MGWKKLTVIVVAAAALVGGALSLSMYLTRQQELEMEVADQKPQPPQAGDTTTLADMENMPIYYDDEEVLLLPVRNVVEGLGGSVSWDREKKATEISFYGKKLLLNRGSKDAELNGYEITLDREVEAINGCLYVSSDVFSDYFATEVIWDSTQQLVTIKTGDNTKPVIAGRVLEGVDGERNYSAEIPVVVGLNDISYEKSLNDAFESFALEQLESFPNVVPAEEAAEAAEDAAAVEQSGEETAAKEQTDEEKSAEGEAEETKETAEEAEKEELPKPNHVRLGFMKGYIGPEFLSFYWEVDVDGKLSSQGVNIDLQGQKYVDIFDLTASRDIETELHVYAQDVDPENYYISAKKEWILLSNDAENGTYQAVSVPAEMAKSVWKDKYMFLIG